MKKWNWQTDNWRSPSTGHCIGPGECRALVPGVSVAQWAQVTVLLRETEHFHTPGVGHVTDQNQNSCVTLLAFHFGFLIITGMNLIPTTSLRSCYFMMTNQRTWWPIRGHDRWLMFVVVKTKNIVWLRSRSSSFEFSNLTLTQPDWLSPDMDLDLSLTIIMMILVIHIN